MTLPLALNGMLLRLTASPTSEMSVLLQELIVLLPRFFLTGNSPIEEEHDGANLGRGSYFAAQWAGDGGLLVKPF
jgi:hypothetical protein